MATDLVSGGRGLRFDYLFFRWSRIRSSAWSNWSNRSLRFLTRWAIQNATAHTAAISTQTNSVRKAGLRFLLRRDGLQEPLKGFGGVLTDHQPFLFRPTLLWL